ncbi:MAG: response regulator [Mucilaginibacter sp.]|uniref:response regulator transcription factor n=1 Tax=Mucilaginibacter sp. TaxID=1882438 RepID=UPI00326685A1
MGDTIRLPGPTANEEPVVDNLRDINVHSNKTNAPLLLLVEDNLDMRAFLRMQLSEIYRVETAADGLEGLEMVKLLMPDIVLSDVMMPKMDGIELIDKLKNDVNVSHIPVVLMSARSAVEHQIIGLNYGADYYLSKPFKNELLLAAINNILDQRKKIFQKLSADKKIVNLAPGDIIVTSKDEIFLKKVLQIISENMADSDFDIEKVSHMVNMGRANFYKKFKSLTQIAPVEFVRDMRLQRAKQYFDAGGGNVAEIAYTVGFSSPKYFSTCFKTKYNISPSDYLKSSKPAINEKTYH